MVEKNRNANDRQNRIALRHMAEGLEIIRAFRPDLPVQVVSTLLIVAAAPLTGIYMSDVAEKLGMAQSSASRNVASLSKINRHKEKGLGLVQTRLDPMDFRKKIVSLTPEGRRVIDAILDKIN